MNVFDKRPLGLILCIILGGFSLFALFDSLLRGILIVITLLFLAAAFFFKPLSDSKVPKIAAIALLCSFIVSYIYFDAVFYPEKYYDKEITATGTVNDYDNNSDYCSTVDFNITKIDNEFVDYNVKLYLYGYQNIEVGDVITVKTKLTEFSVGEDFDFKSYYTSRGFCAKCTASEFVLDAHGEEPLIHKLDKVREDICQRAVDLAGEDAGGLLGALLLGERELVSKQLELDFQRTGIIHILSLSGMHLAILTAALDKLLYIIRINKKVRTFLGCIFSLLFMALTGFPITVCRAGIMLIVSSVLTLISGNKDSITSLAIAGVMVVAMQPYSALDIGLWLSLLSTFGILVAAETFRKYDDAEYNQTKRQKLVSFLKLSLMFSLFAISGSMLITAFSFEYVSMSSVLATPVFSFLTEALLYIGILMLIFGTAIPIAPSVEWLSDIITKSVGVLSDIPAVYASSTYLYVRIPTIALCVLFFAFIILKVKNKVRYITVLCLLFVSLLTLSAAMTLHTKSTDSFITASDSGDRILIFSEDKALLFDASAHEIDDGYNNLNFLAEEHVAYLDYYFVPEYTEDLPTMLDTLLGGVLIENVVLPMPRSETENLICLDVQRVMDNYRAKVSFYGSEGFLFGSYDIVRAHSGNGGFTFVFASDGNLISYMTSGALDDCYGAEELLYVSNTLIFGAYGNGYEKPKMIDDYATRLRCIVSYDGGVIFDFEFAKANSTKIYTALKRVAIN